MLFTEQGGATEQEKGEKGEQICYLMSITLDSQGYKPKI